MCSKLIGFASEKQHAEDLVRCGIWKGLWLAKYELSQICLAYDVPKPEGTGKAKPGKVRPIVKKDLCGAIINFFFPDCNKEDYQRMFDAIMGHKTNQLDVELLEHVAMLDIENAQAFEKQKQEAQVELERIIKKRGIVEEEEQRYEKSMPEVVADSKEPKQVLFELNQEKDCLLCIKYL